MRIYFYHKVDRGFYEPAYASWRKRGGRFDDHLLDQQSGFNSWARALERLGIPFRFDLRSSYLVPQALRCYLPLPIAKLVRGALWVSKLDPLFLQRDILHRIEQFHADIGFFPLGSSVWSSTLRELKRRGVPLVQWCGLPATTMLTRDRVNLPNFDLIFVPANLEKGLRAAGAKGKIEYVPLGVDPEIHHPMRLTQAEVERYQSDVCFIGGVDMRFHKARRAMIEYAVVHGVKMKVWGGYREHILTSPIRDVWQGQIWGEDMRKALCAAKIGLNFHVDHAAGELDRGLNMRAFELAGCGVFQLLQRVPGVCEFFEEGKEIVCFDTAEEMLDKIDYYLSHDAERERIAQAGRERALRDHTWAQRVERMVKLMEELVASRTTSRPSEEQNE